MTPEAQRVAIAEACGTMKWSYALPTRCIGSSVPDYLNDLNAMHEAESWLLENQADLRTVYRRLLIDASEKSHHYWRATAAQRAEAFLRTLNLWKDSTPE